MSQNSTKTVLFLGLSFLSLPLLTSCSSYFKRKDCEATNWYDYGYQVAMTGKRLSGDPLVDQCRKVDANINESQMDLGFKAGMGNYCKPEIVLATGKKGQFFNADLCDPGQARFLAQKHQEGVQSFCDPKNAATFGASGGVYNNICPKDLETGFMREYRKGRKKFLNQSILENEQRISKLNSDAEQARNSKSTLEVELRSLETVQIIRTPPNNVNTPNVKVNDPLESKLQDLKSKITQKDIEINRAVQNKDRLQNEIYSMKKEILSLED